MDDIMVIFVLTMVTVNICGLVYITKTFTKFICKVVRYMNLMEKETEQ